MPFLLEKSPLQCLDVCSDNRNKATIWVKRDDLIHPTVQGNKWRKLKYNLEFARAQGYKTILTFGGAFSNHLYAVAAAGQRFDFQTISIVRGERTEPLNPTLQFAMSCGMQLYFVSRSDYRMLSNQSLEQIIAFLNLSLSNTYLLPEGGTNDLAMRGCSEIIAEIREQLGFAPNVYAVAVGTGGTFAGMLTGLTDADAACQAIGYAVLKGNFLEQTVQNLLDKAQIRIQNDWKIENAYHFGGYAKIKPELLQFKRDFEQKYAFELDYVYTSKLFYGLFQDLKAGRFLPNSHVVAIHTGGLQGNKGLVLPHF
jgi:1-aminocyclopropane-1-carboxylate deaminase/D-cysteine desulfhydrase-like pyridoxal-dependent ACC family enzyme